MRQPFARAITIAAALVTLAAPAHARAQSGGGDDAEDAVCFGFAFGAWSPPLDWRAAGHGDRIDTTHFVHAPEGRDWAAEASSPRDTVLLLFPAWWPVGVEVAIPARRIMLGDTVTGRATAFVGDGRLQPPVAKVRAWRVRCGSPASPPPIPHPADTSQAKADSIARRSPAAPGARPGSARRSRRPNPGA